MVGQVMLSRRQQSKNPNTSTGEFSGKMLRCKEVCEIEENLDCQFHYFSEYDSTDLLMNAPVDLLQHSPLCLLMYLLLN
ncbi:hypothetical protein JOB18_001929 [Solea senegalensis]|uniref:Uncharacterized protein n=1 Tax=Solea senegalensis TaxID=28829 RepID=A0AAV6PP36_SOLSE|nr:hypothetical protein JOB18_001929 [Solea senegalensis]